MLVDVRVSFPDDEASAWNAFTDEDRLGGRSSSLKEMKDSGQVKLGLLGRTPTGTVCCVARKHTVTIKQ